MELLTLYLSQCFRYNQCSSCQSHIRASPSKFKLGIVTSLPKNRTSECTEPSNYRTVTNLNSISKILERLVSDRLVSHVTSSPRFDPTQSAYRRFYSTETVLLKITSDIYQAFDYRQSTVVVALDQSAAFDCVDHNTLLTRLQHVVHGSDMLLTFARTAIFIALHHVKTSLPDDVARTVAS